jgi:hypothetical protein
MSTPTLSPKQCYDLHKETLRDIIAVDHFSNAVPPSLVDLWVAALDPIGKTPLPPSGRGFYNGDLRSSIPIELAHDSYKYVVHETDQEKATRYASRMLVALSLLDMDKLATSDATLACLALWHQSLALARLPHSINQLLELLDQYEIIRPKSTLSDAKLPLPARLRARLLKVANDVGNSGLAESLRVSLRSPNVDSDLLVGNAAFSGEPRMMDQVKR